MPCDVKAFASYAHQVIPGSSTAIALNYPEGMTCVAAVGTHAPSVGVRLNPYRGLSGDCIRQGRTQVSNEVAADARVERYATIRLGVRSLVYVPIRRQQAVLGLLAAFSDRPNCFGDAQILLLELLARLIAEGVEKPCRPAARPPATQATANPEIFAPKPPQSELRSSWRALLPYLGCLVAVLTSLLLLWRWNGGGSAQQQNRKEDLAVQHWSAPGYTRLTIAMKSPHTFECQRLPSRESFYCDVYGLTVPPEMQRQQLPADDLLRSVQWSQFRPGVARVTIELQADAAHLVTRLHNSPDLLIELFAPRQKAALSRP